MIARGRIFVFIDEFQKVARITELVKLFYESGSEIKFVLTGSSSMLIADKISESLLGRTETFILYPFSFREFLSISASDWPFSLSLSTSSEVVQRFLIAPEAAFADVQEHYSQNHYAYQSIVSQQLPRYLLTGGYPQAALAANSEEAFLRLKEIKQTFVEKDIVSLLRIEKLAAFDRCLRMLALQSGMLIQYNDLQTGIGVNFQTIKQFLNIVEATYFWSPIQVYSTNRISTIKKRPKAYFSDLGMRNYLASTFDRTQLEKEKGEIAENFVYLHLLRLQQYRLKGMAKLAFWRSPDGNEVDFVLGSGANVLPIEVKFQKSGQVKIQRGFHIFLRKLELEQAIVVSNSTLEERRTSECRIFIIPIVLLGMV
ncbi:MAG: ATP-binding protein [bacterium]